MTQIRFAALLLAFFFVPVLTNANDKRTQQHLASFAFLLFAKASGQCGMDASMPTISASPD